MTEFAHVENNIPRELSTAGYVLVPAGGGHPTRKVPVGNLVSMTEAERNAISCYTIGEDTAPVPSNEKSVGRHLVFDQPTNTVKWHDTLEDLPIDERKAAMRDQVDLKMRAQIAIGYSHDFGPGLGGIHELDTRPPLKPEWLDYRNACKELIDAGNGSSVMTLPIRTKAEIDLAVRANQGMACMQGMRTREGTIIAHARSLRDQIRLAADHAALDAIDINAGWPA